MTSVQVAQALADGWRRARPDDEILLCPLADGGEGTLAAIEAAGGWQGRTSTARDPLGRQITARWLISNDGQRAAVEMAAASGLSLLTADERDPIRATSIGTGDLIRAALNARVRSIVLGIGGSATTDGGAGLLTGLGAHADRDTATVDLADLDPRLATVELQVACDVSNPLSGPTGAAAVYGPQKGATRDDVEDLDRRLDQFADTMDVEAGRPERATPGAGAAGGVGYALLSIQDRFRSFGLRPGVDLVMDATDFDARLARADLVITGEGRIDAQTAFGKTALGVAAPRGGSGRTLHRSRWRRRARRHRGPRGGRCGRGPGDRTPADRWRRRWPQARHPWNAVASASPRSSVSERRSHDGRRSLVQPPRRHAPKPKRRPRPKKRKFTRPGAELREAARALPARARAVRARRPRLATATRPGSAGWTRRAS